MKDTRIEQLKKLLENNPDNALGRFGLANEYYKNGEFNSCIQEINHYLELKDDEGFAYRLLAESYLNLGNKDKAIQMYKKGIEVSLKHGHPSMAEEFEEALEFINQ